MLQQTLTTPTTITGVSLHSGQKNTVTLHPAPENHGIVFKLGNALIPCKAENVTETLLQTVLQNSQGDKVATIEHLMAALCALEIDNCLIEVTTPELPILDGSAKEWVKLIDRTGTTQQQAERTYLTVTKTIEVKDGQRLARAEPHDDFVLSVLIDYNHPQLPEMQVEITVTPETFRQKIAPARTFIKKEDIEAAKAAGLAKGGSLENAVVIGQNGPINSGGLRFPAEPLLHKVLDCIGDLYVGGQLPKGKFTFVYPGHGLNNQLLRQLTQPVKEFT